MAKGIIANFIEGTNVGDLSSVERSKDITSFSSISDPIKFRSGNFFVQDAAGLLKAETYNQKFPIRLEFIDSDKIKITAEKSYFSTKKYENGFVKTFFDQNLWSAFLKGGNYGNNSYTNLVSYTEDSFAVFTDHNSSYSQPISVKNPINKNNVGINFYNTEFYYNYFSPLYESAISNYNVSEQTIPDFYSFSRYYKNPETAFDEVNRISLGGAVQGTLYRNLINKNNSLDVKKQYFEEYGRVHEGEISKISLKNQLSVKDVIVTQDDLSNKNIDDYSFPIYSAIQMYNQGRLEFNQAIEETNLSDDLISSYVDNFPSLNTLDFFFFKKNGERYKEQIKLFDFKQWHKQNVNNFLSASEANLTDSINLANLTQKVNQITRKNLRTLKEVYEGKPAYSELLIYKIEKYFNNPKGIPIQTFYIYPDNNRIIQFFDTQLKHNRKYAYKVTAIVLVVGNEYNYKDFYSSNNNPVQEQFDISNGIYTIKYENKSSIKLLELPYFIASGRVLESPTSFPEAKFETFKLLDDKVKIKLNKVKISDGLQPVSIENEDSAYFKDLLESQDNLEQEEYIPDFNLEPVKIQIYKTTTKPNFYFDFSGKLYNTIEKNVKSEISFNDVVVPNVKYYYMFRYLNNHDYPSNPSKVYEVELKSEDKINYLEVKEINLSKGINSVNQKTFKNLLQINPSIKQTIFSESLEEIQKYYDSGDLDKITLGIAQKAVWDKKFKLRVTSKKTGKKIDINFDFKILRKNSSE